MQYIRQTKRMNSHMFNIKNSTDPAYSTHVTTHFNLNNQSIIDFSFMPIDVVSNDIDSLCKGQFGSTSLTSFI